MGVGDASSDESVGCDAVDCHWQDNDPTDIALLVCFDDEQVDAAVNRGLGDGLDLGDVQVVVYRVGRVFASAVVCQTSGAGLRKGYDGR